ncbi:MAG: hypothetical protein EAX95_16575, partial [Candidatus Thorarchaeota archaeon]|nr:hypothetical protein [Candidatus Thorarchaeota archaeon]
MLVLGILCWCLLPMYSSIECGNAAYLAPEAPDNSKTTNLAYGPPTILLDYSHGQYKDTVEFIDQALEGNLTAMGYNPIWLRGGINSTILESADGLILGSIYNTPGFLPSEIQAISDWYNSGSKFLWVSCDSEYFAGVLDNSTAVLEAVGSHVYGEPTRVNDSESYIGALYRVVANETPTNPFVSEIVANVDAVLMHDPTVLYGSNSLTPGENINPVPLESISIDNVYPLLYYSAAARIDDWDPPLPYAHDAGEFGPFVAATLEINAGSPRTSVLLVAGSSPYGYYYPMAAWKYAAYDIPLTGNYFVYQAIDYGMRRALSQRIVFDFSHGQATTATIPIDNALISNLTAMGYFVDRAVGGINSSILDGAIGLLAASIYREENAYLPDEIQAVADWYNSGRKFMWIGYDSDYTNPPYSGQFINDNMTAILEAVGSHVYGEPTSVEDEFSNAGMPYRVIATQPSTLPQVQSWISGVGSIFMHDATLLYGSDSDTPGENVNPVALESIPVHNVFPLFYYADTAYISDNDYSKLPFAHADSEMGAFVAVTLELNAGPDETGVLVVSGSSPYLDYRPICTDEFLGSTMDGNLFVRQVIDLGIK